MTTIFLWSLLNFLILIVLIALPVVAFVKIIRLEKRVAKIETKLRDVVKDLYNTTGNES